MSKYIGRGARVIADGLTNGRSCVIEAYDSTIGKYEVSFDGSWCGWYRLRELNIDKEVE